MKILVVFFSASIFYLLFAYGATDKYEVQDARRDVQDKVCECINKNCGCCAPLYIKEVLDGRLCANFSYLSEPVGPGVSATITYNEEAIFNETITASNPPPICALYFEEIQMNICLRLYDMNYTGCLSGCAEFEVKFFHLFPLKLLKLGCFGCRYSNAAHNPLLSSIYQIDGKSKQNEKQPEVVLI